MGGRLAPRVATQPDRPVDVTVTGPAPWQTRSGPPAFGAAGTPDRGRQYVALSIEPAIEAEETPPPPGWPPRD
jgi:hypothetical protein